MASGSVSGTVGIGPSEVELLKTAPYSSFKGPFISQASFDLGRLNGKWTIFDSHQHKISEWEFADGERQGNFTWWFPNGQKMRECHFDNGEMNGRLMEWAPNAKLVTQETYDHGRRLGSHVEKHRSGGNKSEGPYLFAREVVQTPDDWWNAKPAVYTKQGKDERHGHWVAWYPNGQKQTEGEYEHDVPVGEFTWWYANGQRPSKVNTATASSRANGSGGTRTVRSRSKAITGRDIRLDNGPGGITKEKLLVLRS